MEPAHIDTNQGSRNMKLFAVLAVLGLAALYLLMNKNAAAPAETDPTLATTTATSTATTTPTTTSPVTPNPTTQNPSNPQTMDVKVALVALDGKNGTGTSFGCGDKVAFLNRTVPQSAGTLRSSIEALLKVKDQTNGYYNALASSDLVIDSINLTSKGEAMILLKGKLVSGGVCDDPRIIEQFNATAKQFPTVKSVSVTINDKSLSDHLSQK